MPLKANIYQPVSCELHSQYELIIMRGQQVQLNYLDESGATISANVLPVDIQTRNGEEFLVIKKEDVEMTIRLDHILKMRIL